MFLPLSFTFAENTKPPVSLPEIIRSGDVDALSKQLKQNRQLANTAITDSGFRPLHLCVWFDKAEAAEVLRRSKADPSAIAVKGITPLHLAAARGATNTAPVLLRAKAPLNAIDDDGNTPLHLAVKYAQPEIVTLLIESGALYNITNNAGFTPETWAVHNARTGMLEVIHTAIDNRWLINYGRNAAQKYRSGQKKNYDINNDGNIDEREIEAYHQNWYDTSIKQRDTVTTSLLARYDKDGDGEIIYAEVMPLLQEIRALLDGGDDRKLDLLKLNLREFDGDGDGFLSAPEQMMAIEFKNHAKRYEKFRKTQRISLGMEFQTPEEIRAVGKGGRPRED